MALLFPLFGLLMLSVLIETRNDEEGLARTLASLVGAAVEGIVRDVIVCDDGSTDQTHRVADEAGCTFLSGAGVAAGIAQAKCDWLLLIEPGARLLEGWTGSVIAHTAKLAMPGRFSRDPASRRPFLARAFSRPTALAEGLVINRHQAQALSKHAASAEAIARGLAARRLDGLIIVASKS